MPTAWLRNRWQRQPSRPIGVDWSHRLSAGTVAAVSGLAPVEIVTGIGLSAINGAKLGAVGNHGAGLAVRGSQAAFYSRAPRTPFGADATILWLGTYYGSPSIAAGLGGITYDAANTSPYVCIELKVNPSGVNQTYLTYSNGGSAINVAGGNYNAGRQLLIGRVRNGAQDLWQNGTQVATASNAVSALQVSSTARLEVGDSLNGRAPDADCALLWIWSRYLSDAEIAELTRNPWQLLRGADQPLTYTSGDVPLTVAGATHGHSADNLVLVQQHQLALGDAAHAHAADSLTLTQQHLLAMADASHAHAADAVTLLQQHVLAVGDAAHSHAVDNVTLSNAVVLALGDALHAHGADAPTLGQQHLLAVADALHAHAAGALALGQVHVLVVSDALHAQLAASLALSLPGAVIDADRVLLVTAETRALLLVPESRAFAIAAERRLFTIH